MQDILINGKPSRVHIDQGSFCVAIKLGEVLRLDIDYDPKQRTLIRGYGNGVTESLGLCNFKINIDSVEAKISANVVPDSIQAVPVLVGRTFTELLGVLIVKDHRHLLITKGDINSIGDVFPRLNKVTLWAKQSTIIPKSHLVNVVVEDKNNEFKGDLLWRLVLD
ncbi:hypothetical protein NQ314_003071 [Rhamnusium bicolor]|uniref:Peptidase A2 domain-containing protein n=1 Tax=Rhamnusium bicolor TaxID=1586634 RepID=A0AAV8ZN53_9CUCU|nr:hypothetical protein NQ314_003071 [Rhamnusium bicolor]